MTELLFEAGDVADQFGAVRAHAGNGVLSAILGAVCEMPVTGPTVR